MFASYSLAVVHSHTHFLLLYYTCTFTPILYPSIPDISCPPPPRASRGSAIHAFLVYSFNMGIPSLPFPNSLVSRVLSLPPFYFSSSSRYYVFLCNEESKNSIEDWLNLTFYRTFTVFHWKRDASKEPFQFILETCYRWIIKYWCFSFVSIGHIYHCFIFITE